MLLCLITQQAKHNFSYAGTKFMLDGEELSMRVGEMHPSRIPHQYWRHRVQMAKAMGMNTIAIYIMWNAHEQTKGVIDYDSPQNNISNFVKIVQEEGLFLYFRPGPFICGEWDFGGLPTYLLKNATSKVRTLKDAEYKAAIERYVEATAKWLKPLMWQNDGPVLVVQIENEYGSWGRQERDYVDYLVELWKKHGVNGPYSTADAFAYVNENNHPDGAAIGGDGYDNEESIANNNKLHPEVPSFVAEVYPGWLRHWYEGEWGANDLDGLIKEWITHNRTFNLYVLHGGTNFGLTAGANMANKKIQPDLTSYDYGSPITEQGAKGKNYDRYRTTISELLKTKLPDVPAPIPTMKIPAFTLNKVGDIWAQPTPTIETFDTPQYLEYFDQNQGQIVYKAKLPVGEKGQLKFKNVNDYAHIYVNGKLLHTVNRCQKGDNYVYDIDTVQAPGELEIFVDTFGHINFLLDMEKDRKGILGDITFNDKVITQIKHFRYPFTDASIKNLRHQIAIPERRGGFFVGTFDIAQTADTYIDVGKLPKGYIWVNGVNLGRYWDVGPQKRLYLPGVWLKQGKNDIIVYDIETEEKTATISGFNFEKGDE